MSGDFKIGKIEAARRQLETAITLYFNDRDVVSIHTLAAAAHNVLADIYKAKVSADINTMRTVVLENVMEEHRDVVMKKFHEAENFFKHADRDPDAELEYNDGQAESMLWDAIIYYRALAKGELLLVKAFNAWFIGQHPNLFLYPEDQAAAIKAAAAGISKQEFLDMALKYLD